jgi:hypothetical protein
VWRWKVEGAVEVELAQVNDDGAFDVGEAIEKTDPDPNARGMRGE